MAYLEAAMQENFSDETLQVWRDVMVRMNWTNADFRQSVMGIMQQEIYGGLRIQDFIRYRQKRLYTREEAYALAEGIIDERRKGMQEMKMSDEEIEREGLLPLQHTYARKREEAIEKAYGNLKNRIRKAEIFIRLASPELKREMWSLVQVKIPECKGDPHWELSLPYHAADIFEEVEKMKFRQKAVEKT